MRRAIKAGLSIALMVLMAAPPCFGSDEDSQLSPALYCQVRMDFLQIVADMWQAKTDMLNENHSDPGQFEALEGVLMEQEEAQIDSLFDAHATTAEEFFEFGAKCKKQIADYLQENAGIDLQIKSLETAIQDRVTEYENLLTSYGIRGEEI